MKATATNRQPTSRQPFAYGLLTALIIPLFALIPLWQHAGLPNTADGPIHLMRQVQFDQAWAQGVYYPRWGTDLAFGHGMPIFSYAPPSLYFLTQFFHLAGLTLTDAMKAVVGLDFLLYSVGMFLLARRFYGTYPALFAAALYVYAPYRLREAFIQGNYGQFTGLACYPFILWAFHGLITEGRLRHWLAAPLALAALLLSHNISAMLFAPLLATYLLFVLLTQPGSDSAAQRLRQMGYRLLATVIAGLLGLGLSAIFWLPAFGERHDIKLEGITQDFFDFRENFLSLSDLFSPPLRLDLTAINPEFPLSLGLAHWLGVGVAMGAIVLAAGQRMLTAPQAISFDKRPPQQADFLPKNLYISIFFAAWLAIYTLLMLPNSTPIWEAVPLLELTEFPWRMLGPALLCASLISALPMAMLLSARPALSQSPWLMGLACGLILFPIALNLPYLYPSQFVDWGNPTPRDAFQYEIDSGAIGTTSTGEFLPRTAQQHPIPETLWPDYAAGRSPQRIDPTTLPDGATVETLYHRAESEAFRLNTPEPFTVTLRMLYWPGWQIYRNGQPTRFTLTDKTGLPRIPLPAGQSTLTTRLETTPLRTVGWWLTVGSTVGLLGVVVWQTVTFSQRDPTTAAAPDNRATFMLTLPLTTAAVLLTTFLLTRPLESLFVLQSEVNAPQVADRIVQADFGAQIRLVGVDDLPDVVDKSQQTELPAVVYWRALFDLQQNYAVFLHLDAPNGVTFATVDEPSPEFIPTSKWPPGLYLRNVLPLHLPPDIPPIRYDVTVGVYEAESGRRLPLPTGETAFPIDQIWLTEPPPPLPSQPLARFGEHITLWHLTSSDTLTLVWETDANIDTPLTIFVHLLTESGNLIEQLDGAPFDGLYPLTAWLPQHPIVDRRPLPAMPAVTHLAIGLYDPTTGERLPARSPTETRLADDRLLWPIE